MFQKLHSRRLALLLLIICFGCLVIQAPAGAAETSSLTTKLQSIILPSVHFSGASLQEAVEFLWLSSRDLDDKEPDPTRRGVNIVLDPRGAPADLGLSLELKDVPLKDCLSYVAELAGMSLKVESSAVVLVGRNAWPADNGLVMTRRPPWASIVMPRVGFAGVSQEEALEFVRVKMRALCALDGTLTAPSILVKPGGDAALTLSLELNEIPVLELLRYIALLSDHELKVDGQVVILTPRPRK